MLEKLRRILTPINDQWTWKMQDGQVFEEVKVLSIVDTMATIEHKYGQASIDLNELQSPPSEWAYSLPPGAFSGNHEASKPPAPDRDPTATGRLR